MWTIKFSQVPKIPTQAGASRVSYACNLRARSVGSEGKSLYFEVQAGALDCTGTS